MKVLSSVVLASASPRRYEILRSLGLDVRVVPSTYDEPVGAAATPEQLALEHARTKANEVAARVRCELVVAADTVVDVDGSAYRKPVDEADAARMLRLLSGRSHLVHTAISLVAPGGANRTEVHTTNVRFLDLSNEEIEEFVASGEPLDKAGAYGIQGAGATFVESICGDFYTVMGFPIAGFARALPALGFRLNLANTIFARHRRRG